MGDFALQLGIFVFYLYISIENDCAEEYNSGV